MWRDALAGGAWMPDARVLKHDTHSWVMRAMMLGRDVVVKGRALHTPSRRLKSALRMGHGDKHWRGARLLMSRGIPTGAPIGHFRASADGVPWEVLVLEHVEGPTLLECLAKARDGKMPVREQHAIARAVGEQVAAMRRAVVWNRDHKPSNLIIEGSDPAHPRVVLIDCVGVSWWTFVGDVGVERMLTALMLEPMGCGCRPRAGLWMTAIRAMFGEKLSAKRRDRHFGLRWYLDPIQDRIRRHGDPTPKVNPLRS